MQNVGKFTYVRVCVYVRVSVKLQHIQVSTRLIHLHTHILKALLKCACVCACVINSLEATFQYFRTVEGE